MESKMVYYCAGKANKDIGAWCFLKFVPGKKGFKTEESSGNGEGVPADMELMSAYKAIVDAMKCGVNRVEIYIHSSYVVNGIGRRWVEGWADNDWKTRNGNEIKNIKIWQNIHKMIHEKGMSIRVNWVKAEDSDIFIEYVSNLSSNLIGGENGENK